MKLVLLVFIVCLPSDYVRGDTDDAAESGIQSKWAKEPFAAQSGEGTRIAEHKSEGFTVYSNLWYHNQRFHAILDSSQNQKPSKDALLGKNIELVSLPISNAASFYANIEAQWLKEVTLVIDFPLPAYPENFGHWLEILIPVYCVLSEGKWQPHAPGLSVERIIFTDIARNDVLDIGWIWSMWTIALSPNKGEHPKLIFSDDLDIIEKNQWLGLESVLIAHNRYTDQERFLGFTSPALAKDFRDTGYRLAKMEMEPNEGITLMTSVAGEMIVNQLELEESLDKISATLKLKNRPYTATHEAPFSSFLGVMRRTKVLIARHSPLLANIVFLQPGSVVIELLPYNWDFQGASTLYKNLTKSMGDIHHFAWRAYRSEQAFYETESDALYQNWTSTECQHPDCLIAHALAGMLADCSEIEQMIRDIVPRAVQGESVLALERAWPEI